MHPSNFPLFTIKKKTNSLAPFSEMQAYKKISKPSQTMRLPVWFKMHIMKKWKMEAKLTLAQHVKSVCMGTWSGCRPPINKII